MIKKLAVQDLFPEEGTHCFGCGRNNPEGLQIKSYCEKALWLDHGNIKMLGDSSTIVNDYASYEKMKADSYRAELAKVAHISSPSSFLFIKDLSVIHEGSHDLTIEFIVESSEAFHGHIGWAILRKDMLQISLMTTKMQGREPILFKDPKKVRVRIDNLNIVNDDYLIYVGIFDKQVDKPIAVESVDCTINTGYEIMNQLCYFNSFFIIE